MAEQVAWSDCICRDTETDWTGPGPDFFVTTASATPLPGHQGCAELDPISEVDALISAAPASKAGLLR